MRLIVENGELKIDVYELLEQLTAEEQGEENLKEMYQLLRWYHPVYLEIVDSLRDTFVSPNMNVTFYKLLKDFFVLPGRRINGSRDSVILRMTQAMREILAENARTAARLRLLERVPAKINGWLTQMYGEEVAREVGGELLKAMRVEDGRGAYGMANEMVGQVSYSDFVEDWVDAVYEMFGSGGQESE